MRGAYCAPPDAPLGVLGTTGSDAKEFRGERGAGRRERAKAANDGADGWVVGGGEGMVGVKKKW